MQAAITAGYTGAPDPRCRLAEILLRAGRADEAHPIFAEVKADTPTTSGSTTTPAWSTAPPATTTAPSHGSPRASSWRSRPETRNGWWRR